MGKALKDEAQFRAEFKDNQQNKKLWLQAGEYHLKLTDVLCGMFMQIISQNEDFKHLNLQENTLDFQMIIKFFPNVCKVSRITQIQDDIEDWFADILEQKETGYPAPNILLAHAYSLSGCETLKDFEDNLIPDGRDVNDLFKEYYHNPPECIKRALDGILRPEIDGYIEQLPLRAQQAARIFQRDSAPLRMPNTNSHLMQRL